MSQITDHILPPEGRGGHCIPVDPYYLVHRAEELGYHPQVIPDFFTKNRVKTALWAGLQFLVAKMDGVAVAHDEFRGMGLSGVQEFLGAGAVLVNEGKVDVITQIWNAS